MADYYSRITDEQAALIRNADLFFVATADPNLAGGVHGEGPVNLSPKGGVPLHILGPNRVAYLDYVGSGNETARHSSDGGPITVMICSFEKENAAVIRLWGRAKIVSLAESNLTAQLLESAAVEIALPQRQIIDITVTSTVTSCGYGVPVMISSRDRTVKDRGRQYKERR